LLGNNASTTNPQALQYFNAVRSRAGVSKVTSITPDMIWKERRIELAFEGQYWFDLVRLSYYKPQAAINSLNNQKRQQFSYNQATGVKTPSPNGLIITPATVATFTLPIPANDQTADPKLLEEPVAYY
jgi:hypothetical protein